MGDRKEFTDLLKGMDQEHDPCSNMIQERVPLAQWLEHCVSSAKVVGSIPREHMY